MKLNSPVSRLKWAQLTAFFAKAKATHAALVKERADADAKIAEMQQSLAKEIISQTRPPRDNYNGPDEAALIKLAQETWAKAYPKDEVLATRIVMSQWQRKTGWRWHSVGKEFYKYDYSILQAQVVVKTSDTEATVYIVHFHKAHLKGDKVTAGAEKKENIPLYRRMLLSNFK